MIIPKLIGQNIGENGHVDPNKRDNSSINYDDSHLELSNKS